MVTVYVDTSIIIARYKPNDPLHSIANRFFEKDYDFIISPITIVELYSVLSRIKPFLKFKEELKNANIDTIVAFIIYDSKLRIVTRSFMPSMQILGKKFRVPLEYRLAMKFAEKLQLRTLDLLHIAYAYMLRDMLDYVVTGDDDVLKARELIKQCTGLEVVSPSKFV